MTERALPAGTVTLLFTDIEGSTALAERLGARWPTVLAEHNRIVREAIAAHGGIELGSEGDSLFAAFTRALHALRAAAAAQRTISAHAWPDGATVRVRMGVHTGEPTVTLEGYVGLDMHRAARVMAAGHGGQVLVSETTRQLLDDSGEDLGFVDLGPHRLKDLSGPQHLYQLHAEGLASDFPPPRAIDVRATNLPVQPTRLVGRTDELAAISRLLAVERTRVVTLTGPGGIGKTRLAFQVAADLVGAFPDGIYAVLLAPITEPGMVALELARALGVDEAPDVPILDAVTANLANRRTLIVFDNFEQVTAAAGLVADLVGACAGLKALVTSREPLRIAAEQQYPVPPLTLPPPLEVVSPKEAAATEAVALFVERARAVLPEFALTDETAPVVAEICRRLDGLPLAIELAAAWSKVLSPTALLRRLERRLGLPPTRSADVPARQSTLRQAIEWSYDLLPDTERALHTRLSVFAGGWTLETAEDVVDPEGELGVELFEAIASLTDRSLVRRYEGLDGEPRFTMLGTIREYAREQLSRAGDETQLLRRHALVFARFADEASAGLRGSEQLRWFDRLESEHDNLRAALDSSLASEDAETALRIGGALGWFWYAHGHAIEGCTRLMNLLAHTHDAPEELRARPMYALGVLLNQRGDTVRAAQLVERSLAVFRAQGDDERVAAALNSLGSIKRELGDLVTAGRLLEESVELRRTLKDERGMASTLSNLGNLAFEQGRLDAAKALFSEAIELDRAHGNEWGAAASLDSLAAVALERGEVEEARDLICQTLSLAERVRDREVIAFTLERAAVLAALEQDAGRAGRLLGAADSLRESTGIQRPPFDSAWLDRHLAAAQGTKFDAGRTAGRTIDTDEALHDARNL